jgi:hypothetical protein
VIREAFRARGHDAWSCDLEQADDLSDFHFRADVLDTLHRGTWHLFIVHPPCTYLTSSGLHWNRRRPGREAQTDAALSFVTQCLRAPVHRICLENPQGCINTRLPWAPWPQYIQPYEFGDDASKKTGLWLIHLPPLRPTVGSGESGEKCRIARRPEGRLINSLSRDLFGFQPIARRFANQTDSGQNRLGPSPSRAQERARSYPGIAQAMAEQWG